MVKGEETRDKRQQSTDKSQGTRAHDSLNFRTSEPQNLKTKGQGTKAHCSPLTAQSS